jgi:hypothetical protein
MTQGRKAIFFGGGVKGFDNLSGAGGHGLLVGERAGFVKEIAECRLPSADWKTQARYFPISQ